MNMVLQKRLGEKSTKQRSNINVKKIADLDLKRFSANSSKSWAETLKNLEKKKNSGIN